MSDEATRMRDAGRSWTEISQRLGVPVPELKQRVQADKITRREALSRTRIAEDRNGLRDLCTCGCPRKVHADLTGLCSACGLERTAYEIVTTDGIGNWSTTYVDEKPTIPEGESYETWWFREEQVGCEEFVHHKRNSGLPWYRLPEEVDPQYVDPNIQLSDRVSIQAHQLGVQKRLNGRNVFSQPKLETLVRRARKKLKAGKPVKKHRDRPGRWGR